MPDDIGVIMETPYTLPSGLTIRVVDTATAGQALGNAVQSWQEGATEPLFYGSQGRPEGVVISFDQWSEYETLREDAENDARRYEVVRQRIANDDPSKWETYEEMMDRYGLDPDSDELKLKETGQKDGDGES